MALGSNDVFRDLASAEPGLQFICGRILTTTSGTVSTTAETAATALTASRSKCKVTVAKVAATNGRYTLTLAGKMVRLFGMSVSVEMASSTAAYTAGKANTGMIRLTTTSVVRLQMVLGVSDAEVEDGAIIHWAFWAQFSKARG